MSYIGLHRELSGGLVAHTIRHVFPIGSFGLVKGAVEGVHWNRDAIPNDFLIEDIILDESK